MLKTGKKSKQQNLKLNKMSTKDQREEKIQELEGAKSKLSNLITQLKENPSLTDEELNELEGGTGSSSNTACNAYKCG